VCCIKSDSFPTTFSTSCGLDEEGRGAVYSFDPVGTYEREEFRAGGSAATLHQPFLDNRIGRKGQNLVDTAEPGKRDELSLEKAVSFVKDAFIAASFAKRLSMRTLFNK
jgi:20S proteasome subunit beta 6